MDESAETVGFGPVLQVIFLLKLLLVLWGDQVGLVLDQQTWNVGVVPKVGIVFDDLFPFESFLQRASLCCRADNDTAYSYC